MTKLLKKPTKPTAVKFSAALGHPVFPFSHSPLGSGGIQRQRHILSRLIADSFHGLQYQLQRLPFVRDLRGKAPFVSPAGKKLLLPQTLSQRIIGQQAAVDAVSAAVLRGRTGLADAGRPAASFLLIGPTGVGKTELCKQIAQVVYGSQDALIRVDMSEYMEPNSVSRLLGAPPGYVGYDAGGTLTEKVRSRPYCVVLFDELEKAHRDITGILLQLLGDGILTDSLGRTVSFKNTIVVMTSNLTGPQTGKPGLGFTPDCADIRAQTILREAFSPEFLGRIDCIASFRPLAAEDLARIAALQLRELAERLKRQNVALEFAPELPEHLGALCANEPGGARSLRRRLQTEIEGPAAELLLRDPSVRTLRAVWRQARVVVEAPERCF